MSAKQPISFLRPGATSVDRVRADGSAPAVSGFVDVDGTVRPAPGDDVPFVAAVPQVFPPVDYLDRTTLAVVSSVSDYRVGPTVQTQGLRSLILYLQMTIAQGESAGGISVLPEALVDLDLEEDVSFPVGVVDITLETPGIVDGYSARDVFQNELRFAPGADQSPAPSLSGVFRWATSFDVSDFAMFRFRLGALDDVVRVQAWVAGAR